MALTCRNCGHVHSDDTITVCEECGFTSEDPKQAFEETFTESEPADV